MVTISADAAAVMAQVVAAIVFAAVLELRRGYTAQTIWELRILAGVLLLLGFVLAGGLLLELIMITAQGGTSYKGGPPIEVWIATRFLVPIGIFLLAEQLRKGGRALSPQGEPDRVVMTWAWKELLDGMKANSRQRR